MGVEFLFQAMEDRRGGKNVICCGCEGEAGGFEAGG